MMDRHTKPRNLTDEEFATLYPATTNADLVGITGVSLRTVVRWARRLGLDKSPAFLKSLVTGANNYGWKGGRPLRDARFLDPAYVGWRTAVLERDGYRCVQCGVRSKTGRGLHAHHLRTWVDAPAERYCVANGQTLCFHCHNAAHGRQVQARLPRPCACGCGADVIAPRRFVSGHNWRGKKRGPQKASHRRASAAARRGRALGAEHRQAIAHALKGRPLTDNQRSNLAALAEAKRGVPRSAETRAKISAVQKGQKRTLLSAATRAKISAALRRRPVAPLDPSFEAGP